MSDATVHAALRSDVGLVVIEAPGGCGKTHQGAEYAHWLATTATARTLILTHTNAACSVFAVRTNAVSQRVEIRTLDSLICEVAVTYHAGLRLPADVGGWIRERKDGYAQVAARVAALLRRYPMIAAVLAKRFPVVICDEHQDCSSDQHAITQAMLQQGARLRVFADPMQQVYKKTDIAGGSPSWTWDGLKASAHRVEELDQPHRWRSGSPDLGAWTLKARAALRSGGKVDLRRGLPPTVRVVFAENTAQRKMEYQLDTGDRREIDAFARASSSLLILAHHNDTARSLRSMFGRRIPLWEGHTREGLERLVGAVKSGAGDPGLLAAAAVRFIKDVGKGFSPTAFGNQFEAEAREGCSVGRRGKPARIQQLARFLVDDPSHRGVARMLQHLAELMKDSSEGFGAVALDHQKEFWDAVRLGRFDDLEAGLVEITGHRTRSHPRPADRAISTIHKAKGLECDDVIVMPCDARTFADKADVRCLLYVALSRAKRRLMLVVSRTSPSPLLEF